MKNLFKAVSSAAFVGLAIITLATPLTASAAESASMDTSNNATLKVDEGSFDLSDLTSNNVKFTDTNVEEIFTKGYDSTADSSVTPVVTDYRGGDGVWNLTVEGDGGFDRLNGELSIADAGSSADPNATGTVSAQGGTVSTAAMTVATGQGAVGVNDLKYSLNLKVAEHTTVAPADSYTENLSWTLAAGVPNAGEGAN